MPSAQAVQSFVGIDNENEFYGHHYLAEVFKGDIRSFIEGWQAAEEQAAKAVEASEATEESSLVFRAPHKRLGGLGGSLPACWKAWTYCTSVWGEIVTSFCGRRCSALTQQKEHGDAAQHRDWITALLRYYYDPMYAYQRESRADSIEFQGAYGEVLAYLRERAGPSSCQS